MNKRLKAVGWGAFLMGVGLGFLFLVADMALSYFGFDMAATRAAVGWWVMATLVTAVALFGLFAVAGGIMVIIYGLCAEESEL